MEEDEKKVTTMFDEPAEGEQEPENSAMGSKHEEEAQ